MNRFSTRLFGATALALVLVSPAMAASKADKAFLAQQHDKITLARGEPGMATNGLSDLDRAEAVLTPLNTHFDGDDRRASSTIASQIDAIIATGRTHARIAAMKTEIVQLQARDSGRLAAAEQSAARAQSRADSSRAETVALRGQLQDSRTDAAASQAESASLRGQLSDYKMTQTALGATLVLSDVRFTTGRADLKSGAVERLRPLATYLQANPEVRVHIDGHTDGQGSALANQSLSDRRANAVRGNLSSMGVSLNRMDAVGHGEDMPVADNATADGRQQNRRVEITLVGQQVARFSAQ